MLLTLCTVAPSLVHHVALSGGGSLLSRLLPSLPTVPAGASVATKLRRAAAAGDAAAADASEAAIRQVGVDGIILRGAHIRQMRAAAHLSVKGLAARLGYSRFTIHDWEADRHACPEAMYETLFDVLAAAQAEYEDRMARLRLKVPLVRYVA